MEVSSFSLILKFIFLEMEEARQEHSVAWCLYGSSLSLKAVLMYSSLLDYTIIVDRVYGGLR